MTRGKFPNGLKGALQEKPVTQAALARHLETHRQNVLRWVKEEQKIPRPTAIRIADYLDVSVNRILALPELAPADRDVIDVDAQPVVMLHPEAPIAGRVGAGGAIVDLDSVDATGLPTISVLAGDAEFAAQISGDSLGRFEGWYAICEAKQPFKEDLYGSLCVVLTTRGETLIKWLERDDDGELILTSGDGSVQANDVDLEWAARVIAIRPPIAYGRRR